MSKSTIKQKLKVINNNQEREIENFKKSVTKKYQVEREKLYQECSDKGHKYDNGNTAIWMRNNMQKYCKICGQKIL